jgi:hypothetical protein
MTYFRIPQNLYDGYRRIKRTPLVRDRNYTETALKEFEYILNSCQPEEANQLEYSVVKFFFMANKKGFCYMIRNNNSEAFVLWTNPNTIVRWFGLAGLVYLHFNKETRTYQVDVHQSLKNEDGTLKVPYKPGQPPPVREHRPYHQRNNYHGQNRGNNKRRTFAPDSDGFQRVGYRSNRYNDLRNDQPYGKQTKPEQKKPDTKSLADFPTPEKSEFSRKKVNDIKNLTLKEDDDQAFQILDGDSWSDNGEDTEKNDSKEEGEGENPLSKSVVITPPEKVESDESK